MKKTLLATLCLFSSGLIASTNVMAAQEPTVSPRVMNGETATVGLLPWQVMVFGNSGTLCGGSIISDHWIVTAAHCTFRIDEDTGKKITMLQAGDYIFAGTTNPHTSGGYLDGSKATKIAQVITHQGYDPTVRATRFDNDIALIRVDESLFARGGKAIRIATIAEQQAADRQFENSYVEGQDSPATLIASGWGHLGTEDKTSNDLQVVKLAGIPDSKCKVSQKFNGNYFVCADSNRASVAKDVCRGDSGGPLVWQNPSNAKDNDKGLRLVGATSNGPYCSFKSQGYASGNGLYTQVPHYRDWIETNSGLTLDTQPKASYAKDPFEIVKNTPPAKPKQPSSNSDSGSGGGGSMPLFGLAALGLIGLLRRKK